MKLYLFGANDDLIEIRGDIKKEWNRLDDKIYIVFSGGTLLSIEYDGEWKIQKHHIDSNADVEVHPAGSEEALKRSGRDYSDVAAIETSNPIIYIALADEVYK